MPTTALTTAQRKYEAINKRLNKISNQKNLKVINDYRTKENVNKEREGDFLTKVLHTGGDLVSNVFSGIAKGLEGIYDFGAGIVGGVGGLFNKDFQKSVQDHISYDFVGNHISNPLQNYFDESYLNDWGTFGEIIEGTASGVGQMLPAVAMNVVAPGSGMAVMTTSAAGNATETAYKEGAGYYQGLGYGIISGGVEALTEKLGSKLFGNNIVDDALGIKNGKSLFKTATTKGGKIVQSALSEGLEEAAAELVNPLTQTIYKGKESLDQYKDKEYWGEVGKAGAVGALTSVAFGETVGRINRNTIDANETLQELKSLEVKEDNLHARGKLFEGGNEQKIADLRSKLRTELSESVSKMKDSKRAEYIQKNNLGDILNADGSLIDLATTSSQTTEMTQNDANNGLARPYNKEAYSPKLFGKEDALLMKPTSESLSQENKDAKLQINKLNKGRNRVLLVFVDSGVIEKTTGNKADALEHNGVIYIDKNANAQKVLATHEFTHTLEGTKEYSKYAKYILKNIMQNENLAAKFGKFDSRFAETFNRYKNVFTQKYGDISKVKGEDYQQMMDSMNRETISELVAQYTSENLFTDESVINRLAQEDVSFVKRILNWIKDKIKSFKAKTKAERETLEFLKKAETLYERALSNVRNYVPNVDKTDNLSYSLNNQKSKRVVRYIPYSKIGEDNIKFIRKELDYLFADTQDGIANNLAIERGNTVYVVDCAKDSGGISFGVRNSKKVSDLDIRNEYIRRRNEESISKGYISDGLSARIRSRYDNDSRSDMRRELGEELSTDSQQSEDYQGTVSQNYGDIRGRVKSSLFKQSTQWGEGYAVDDLNIEDYNIIRPINDDVVTELYTILKKIEVAIYRDFELSDIIPIRVQLYKNLEKQESRVYSKSIEISNAYTKTVDDFKRDNRIDVIPTFIKNLGYNGVYIKPDTNTTFKSVIYDTGVKKVNLLDFSPDRAKARLDKAIKLFGETDNPKRAGWLLSDGRFVDYHRDSANISSESKDAILDYEDHWHIEKVYDTRRGTDAIDAFMAEGNIRLMPEDAGIEIRNKPSIEQQFQLIRYIDAVIGKKGLLIDLRPVNSTENYMYNYVFYDASTDAKTIINDINTYYNRGSISRTVNGIKFSLSKNSNESLTEQELWSKLTKQDQAILYKGIDEIHHQGFWEYQLDNGDYVIDVNNKVVISDGDFEKPSIEGFVEFTRHSSKISEARDYFYEKIINGRTIRESIKFINDLYEEEVAIFYGRENSKYNSEVRGQREYYFEDREIGSNREERARVSKETKYSITKGQSAKFRANNSKMKVYSKIEAEKLINDIIDNQLNFNNKVGSLQGKTKAEAINQMFVALNSVDAGYRIGIAGNIADYIIENAIYEDMYDDGVNEQVLFEYDILKEYRGKLDLESIKGEIRHKFDDKANAIIMQWGKRKGDVGQSPDAVAMELQESGIHIESNNSADIFFEMVDMYNKATKELKKTSQTIKSDYFSESELKQTRQEIIKDILRGYDKYGSESKFAGLIKKYTEKIALLKETIKDLKERNKAINNLYATIDRVKGLEKFKSSEIEFSDEVLGLIKLLKNVKTYRGNLSKNVREIMFKYSSEIDGKKLYDLVANNGDGIENPVAQMIEDIAHKNGELSTTEIKQLDEIMRNFIHNVNDYNRVFFEGKTQNDEAIVKQAIKETRETIALKTDGLFGSIGRFTRWLTAPVWRFERLSSYRQDGVMTKIFGELQKGVDKQAQFNMEVAEHFKQFFLENKKIVKDWNKQTFDLNGTKLSRGQVITLYMLFQRKQAQGHLLSNDGESGTVRIANENHAKKGNFREAISKGVDIVIDKTTLKTISDSLTDTEKRFIKLSKEFFDKISKDAKYETDMALYGISNVGEENYIPIRVASDQLYQQFGGDKMDFSELFSVYNASFNKETRPNAKNKIVVENIIDVINRHSKQMASYYGLAVPLKTINRLYNKKLDDGSKLSVEINNVDPEFETYLHKLMADMQGRAPKSKSLVEENFNKVVGKIRSLGAKAALGLNLKVLANQFVSLPAARAIGVKYKNLMKGFAMATSKKTDYDKLTQYCPMLYDRFREGNNIDVGLLKESQGVLGKVDALTDLTTAPIGKIDKFICGAVWNACLEQTKSDKYADYSDEHYKEAAKLTETAVIKTQSNYTALYRPEILRTQNSLLQLSTMFMSEPLQQLSLLASSIDKIIVAKKLIKQNNTPENQALLKQAKTQAATAISAVMIDALLLALIAQAFKWVKGQDDEETVLEGITSELTSNFIGMFPFIKDAYSLVEGYDVTNMAYTGLTNVVNGFKEMWNIVDLLASGEQYTESEIRGKVRKVLIGLSQTFGIPLRNLETYSKGIIEKFSPSFVYMWEDKFNISSGSYTKDLQKAIEKGDDKLADTIINVMLEEKDVEITDEKVRTTMKSLYAEGLNVFPRSIGKTIVHDGESVELTKRQHDKFTNIYSRANDKISSLVNTKSFEDMPSEIKAKSIKYIYDYYYEEALRDLLGIDSDEKKYLFAQAIDIVKLASIVSQVAEIESDKDKNGNIISGSKKAKVIKLINSMALSAVQKYMLMGYFGYKNANGERQVKVYIQSLKLTKTEKETLFSMCGY